MRPSLSSLTKRTPRVLAQSFACGVMLLGAGQASAAILAQYNTGDQADRLVVQTLETGFTSSDLALNLWTASNVDFDLTSADANGDFGLEDSPSPGGTLLTSNVFLRSSVDGADSLVDDGVSFTLTNNSGTDYNLSSFAFFLHGQSDFSNFDAFRLSAQAQINGVDVGEQGSVDITIRSNPTTPGEAIIVNAALSQVLADGESLLFSVDTLFTQSAEGDGTPVGSDGVFEFQEIGRLSGFTVEGSAVPEPTSLALLGLGGLCMMSRRRRR